MLWVHYLFRFLPLDIALQARRQDRPFTDFRFGDTPWFTGLDILQRAQVGPEDRLVDLGSGRGKLVFLAELACHCPATGIELLPNYVRIARDIARWGGLRDATFQQKDFLEADLTRATVVFANAAALCRETLEDLALALTQMRPGTRFIGVGWKAPHAHFELESEQTYLFSWGRESVYFQKVGELGMMGEEPDHEEWEEPRPSHRPDTTSREEEA